MQKDLIYDVGMHVGDDSAYYLHRGYRVVAVEADPSLAEAGRRRFSAEIASGRLTLLEVAIGPKDGVVDFWISSNPEYSSLSRDNASKWGQTCHAIDIPCRTFGSILAEHGVPFYLKIDIEEADRYCLEAIDPADRPRYLSFEKSRLEDLFVAHERGYSAFKLIAQENFRQLHFQARRRPRLDALHRRLRRWPERIARRVRAPGGGWDFPYSSSGPFGEETDGPWRTLAEVALSWIAFDLGRTGAKDAKWEDWFDIHCTS